VLVLTEGKPGVDTSYRSTLHRTGEYVILLTLNQQKHNTSINLDTGDNCKNFYGLYTFLSSIPKSLLPGHDIILNVIVHNLLTVNILNVAKQQLEWLIKSSRAISHASYLEITAVSGTISIPILRGWGRRWSLKCR
jgi:hypothetical protein